MDINNTALKLLPARVLFVNVTKRCNVDCPRCYLTPLNRNTRDSFSLDALTSVLAHPFFSNYDGPVLVIHQGGEPQLLGFQGLSPIVKTVESVLPEARQTVVTNLFTAPAWFRDMAIEYFQGRIETTWAAGRKQTLAGSEERFQEMFRSSLQMCVSEGLSCPINVELNDDTFDLGPDHLIDMMLETGAQTAEFDVSVDFAKFREAPKFAMGNAPILPPTIAYDKIASYVWEFRRQIHVRGLQERINSHSILPLNQRGGDLPFNTRCENRFFTLNPNGDITTIPLYSDIEETYLGNVNTDGFSYCLNHANRQARIAYEVLRLGPCQGCEHLELCQGGPSHAPVLDGSGECVGLKSVLSRL